MKIVGLRIEKYIGQNVEGHNCDFEYVDEEMERHILLGILSDNRKVLITLEQSYGECGSGWCTASWGEMKVEETDNFGGYTYKPIKEILIDDITPENFQDLQCDDDDDITIKNEVFELSATGGDYYYPSGYYTINMNLFEETVRAKDKRPVWIFKGESNSGKSFLSHKLSGLTVYETDVSDTLPDIIKEDVVVIGNKYKFDIEDIKSKLFGDVEVTVVDFSILK
jgi:hypothetical protein